MRRATSVIRNHRVREKSTCRLKLLLEHSCYLNCVKLNLFCQSGQLTGPPNTIEQGVLWVGFLTLLSSMTNWVDIVHEQFMTKYNNTYCVYTR